MSFADNIFRKKAKRRAHNKDMGEGECEICFAPSPKPLKQGETYRCDRCKHDIAWCERYEREAYDHGEVEL